MANKPETTKPGAPKRGRAVYLLLLVPIVATLWVPIYNRIDPEIAGIPFFYWYQLLWVPLAALILYVVYRVEGGN